MVLLFLVFRCCFKHQNLVVGNVVSIAVIIDIDLLQLVLLVSKMLFLILRFYCYCKMANIGLVVGVVFKII